MQGKKFREHTVGPIQLSHADFAFDSGVHPREREYSNVYKGSTSKRISLKMNNFPNFVLVCLSSEFSLVLNISSCYTLIWFSEPERSFLSLFGYHLSGPPSSSISTLIAPLFLNILPFSLISCQQRRFHHLSKLQKGVV